MKNELFQLNLNYKLLKSEGQENVKAEASHYTRVHIKDLIENEIS